MISSNVKEFVSQLIKINGTVYGGFVRDLIAGFDFEDIDCFIHSSESELNSKQVSYLLDEIIKFDVVDGIGWLDEPLDDYGQTYNSIHLEVTLKDKTDLELNIVLGECIPIDTKYLDFDANSLYIDTSNNIKSTLGDDRLESIIKNASAKTMTLMREDVDRDRIEYMQEKGYSIKNLEFI